MKGIKATRGHPSPQPEGPRARAVARLACSAWGPRHSGQGWAAGPKASPSPSLGFPLPFYIDGPRIKAAAFREEADEAEDRKQRVLRGAGFGHGWSAPPSPLPGHCPQPPGARQLPQQTAVPKATPGSYHCPGRAGIRNKAKGTHRGPCPTPTPAPPATQTGEAYTF